MADGPVVVVGDAVTDVLVSRVDPLAPGSDARADITVRPGGSAANVAAWLAHLGVPTRLVGRVGADPFGAALREDLRACGVDAHLTVDHDHPTGVIVVLVAPSGERDMLTDRGANRALQPADLSAAALSGAAHLHLSGYVLLDEASQATGEAMIHAARRAGLTLSVGAGSRRPLELAGADRFLEWTAGVELCTANQAEAGVLTGADDPAVAARALAATYREAVVTAGRAGAWWCGGGDVVHAAARQSAAIVDSTGAGDAFTAGFLHGWLAGTDPQRALEGGAALSAVAVGQVGGRPPQQ